MIDHMLDRFAAIGVDTAVINVHYHADQIEAHLARRKTPKIIFSDERDRLLDQGGGIRKALPYFEGEPFFLCNTDAFWLEGPHSNLRRLAAAWDPAKMDILLLVAASATSIGVDWPGDFTMDSIGRLTKREERQVAPFAYAGVGIVKPELLPIERKMFSASPHSSSMLRTRAASSATGSMDYGAMSARPKLWTKPSVASSAQFYKPFQRVTASIQAR